MANESQEGTQINRIFEQPQDSVSFYCDVAQIRGTGNEVVLQFYESIPGPPGPGGAIQLVRTRLRSTVVVSKAHAANIGKLLLQQAGAVVLPDKEATRA
jgi:hypothetical protein